MSVLNILMKIPHLILKWYSKHCREANLVFSDGTIGRHNGNIPPVMIKLVSWQLLIFSGVIELGRLWWHRSLSQRRSPLSPVTIKWASWQLSIFNVQQPNFCCRRHKWLLGGARVRALVWRGGWGCPVARVVGRGVIYLPRPVYNLRLNRICATGWKKTRVFVLPGRL